MFANFGKFKCYLSTWKISWRTWSSKRPREGSKKPRGNPKVRIGGLKRGDEGHRETTRGDKGRRGVGSAAYGRQTGDIGGSSWSSWSEVQHALSILKHEVADFNALRLMPPTPPMHFWCMPNFLIPHLLSPQPPNFQLFQIHVLAVYINYVSTIS